MAIHIFRVSLVKFEKKYCSRTEQKIMVVASLIWVPAGAANPNPTRYQISPEELERLRKLGEADDSDNDNDDEQKFDLPDDGLTDKDFPADLRMDEYSDDDDGDAGYKVGDLLLKLSYLVLAKCSR